MPSSVLSSGSILITGGTGFVGRALVSHVQRLGVPAERLRCLVRDPGRALRLGLPGASLVTGSLEDEAALRRAAAGAELVFHLAGAIKALSRREFDRINGMGTERLVRSIGAAAPADATLVHVSSLAAAGPSVDGAGANLPPESCRPCSNYGESKRLGELAVWRSGRDRRWVIVRPPVVYGPGDAATRLMFRQATAALAPVPRRPRPLSLIHVDDLVRALCAAAECGDSRVAVAVEGPDRLTTHELLRALAAACGRRARLLPTPMILARTAALMADLWAQVRRKPGMFSLDKVREVGAVGWVADPGPARALLRVSPAIPTDEGIPATARAEGLAPDAAAST